MIGDTKHQMSNPLDQYVQLAKATTSKGLVEIIQQALDATGVLTFTELSELPNVKQLQTSEWDSYWNLLQLFSYGTYKDYLKSASQLPPLTSNQKKKLQHLTIVTLAEQGKCIPYSTLLDELQISNLRELEDVIIEAIYLDIIKGKLDQKGRLLEVDTTIGRDIKKEDLTTIVSTLENWTDACENILISLQNQVDIANKEKTRQNQRKDAIEQEIANLKKSIKIQSQEVDEAYGNESREALGIEKTPKKIAVSKKGSRGPGKIWK